MVLVLLLPEVIFEKFKPLMPSNLMPSRLFLNYQLLVIPCLTSLYAICSKYSLTVILSMFVISER